MSNLFQNNLTLIEWTPNVSWLHELMDNLITHSDMIQADITLGVQVYGIEEEPIAWNPFDKHTDLTLEKIFEDVIIDNNANNSLMKGIKLNFKTIEAFEGSFNILNKNLPKMSCPVMLNGDILPGPIKQTMDTVPIDVDRFLFGCILLPQAEISVGWTTPFDLGKKEVAYTLQDIENMLDIFERKSIIASRRHITISVRACLAVNSKVHLHYLISVLSTTNKATLTIWSLPHDNVNIEKLCELICSFGPELVYLNIPTDLKMALHLPFNYFDKITYEIALNVLDENSLFSPSSPLCWPCMLL